MLINGYVSLTTLEIFEIVHDYILQDRGDCEHFQRTRNVHNEWRLDQDGNVEMGAASAESSSEIRTDFSLVSVGAAKWKWCQLITTELWVNHDTAQRKQQS